MDPEKRISPKHKKIYGLESLRFVAFLSIFIGHAVPHWYYGVYSIHLFFILSSFLLTYLLLKEIEQTNKFSRVNFLIRRGLRVYPLYYLIIGFAFIILPIIANYTHQKITLPPNKLTYIFFLSNFDTSEHIFALKFLWSIAVEEQFYLLFILLSFLFKDYFYTAILILISLFVCYRVIAWKNHYDEFDMMLNPFSYFLHYAFGMLAAKLYFKNRLPNLFQLLGFSLFLIIIISIMDQDKNYRLFDTVPISILLTILILIVIQIFKKYRRRNMVIEATEYLGKYTYGLYVYSGFVISFFLTRVKMGNVYIEAIIEFMVLLPIAWVSYHFYEEKFLKLKKLFTPKRDQNK